MHCRPDFVTEGSAETAELSQPVRKRNADVDQEERLKTILNVVFCKLECGGATEMPQREKVPSAASRLSCSHPSDASYMSSFTSFLIFSTVFFLPLS